MLYNFDQTLKSFLKFFANFPKEFCFIFELDKSKITKHDKGVWLTLVKKNHFCQDDAALQMVLQIDSGSDQPAQVRGIKGVLGSNKLSSLQFRGGGRGQYRGWAEVGWESDLLEARWSRNNQYCNNCRVDTQILVADTVGLSTKPSSSQSSSCIPVMPGLGAVPG